MAHQSQQQLVFFIGDSQMHARMGTHDWTDSPLGPPSAWPQTLRTIVNLILCSKLPMCVAWGSQLALLYNDAYASILGKRHPAALGRGIQEVWTDIWPNIHPLIEGALRGQTIFSENQPLKMTRNGYQERAWFTFSYSPVHDEDGDIAGVYCAGTETTANVHAIPTLDADGKVREWVGVHTDITELRRTEEALRQVNARLAMGIEERTRERDRLWRMSHDIMAIASLNGYFVSVNPAFTAALGWTEQEATSVPLSELTHPDDRAALSAKMAQLAQGKPLPRYEVRDLHKDGSFRWLSWTVVPEGDLLYGVARDITLEKQQAEALRHAEEALKQSQKMEAVGQLTGGIAHDFNNLLASMVGNLEILKMRMAAGASDDLVRYVDGALDIADRAASLTHRLLAFSRRQTLAPRLVNINQLVDSMAELIQRTVGPSVQVATVLSENVWNTRCDPNQLESALLNLAINARDAMPDGGKLTIATSNLVLDDAYVAEYPDVAPGEYAAISVIDTGIGMTPEVAARAFDPFFTTKPLGQGTGLGLSTIYGFAKQSGGHIRLFSEPGKGTTVQLKLPRHFGDADADAAQSRRPEPTQAKTRSTLLIVDDEAPLRELLAEMMEMLGYDTVQAANAEEALRILESPQQVDLLVTDVGLPGRMNGKQLVDAARQLRPHLKVLFITGYAADTAMRNGFLDPGMQVMTKPFVIDTFTAKVRGMLEA